MVAGPNAENSQAFFNVYGYKFRIDCNIAAVLDGLADDFAFFASPVEPDTAAITLLDREPDYTLWAGAKASVYTPRNVAYRHDGKTIIDYSGRGLGVHDTHTGSFTVTSRNHDLLYEAAYLFVLSQSGAALDRRNLHRIHALGVSVRGRAALVLLPMGGGKSTLGSALLRHPEVQLLSDDSPTVDAAGNVLAFPLRIGLLPGSETAIPAEQLRSIQRMEFGPKLLVNYKYFSDRVCTSAAPALILIGERSLDNDCTLRPASWRSAWKALLANCVVGLGLFQGMEFIFSRSPSEVVGKLGTVGARLKACRHLLRRSTAYHLKLGRDIDRNADVVCQLLHEAANLPGNDS
jgi:hypothetical protein